jgi:hypothetical protein
MNDEHNVTFKILTQRQRSVSLLLIVTRHNYVKMRKRMRNGADPRNGYGDKMQNGTDLDKIASFLRFHVLDLCLFL